MDNTEDHNFNVNAEYYKNNNNYTSWIGILKEKFFFNDNNKNNDWLKYDWSNIIITAPADKTFNSCNFPSVFNNN